MWITSIDVLAFAMQSCLANNFFPKNNSYLTPSALQKAGKLKVGNAFPVSWFQLYNQSAVYFILHLLQTCLLLLLLLLLPDIRLWISMFNSVSCLLTLSSWSIYFHYSFFYVFFGSIHFHSSPHQKKTYLGKFSNNFIRFF